MESTVHPVERIIHEADRAIVAEDFDLLMGFYSEDAVLVVEPGVIATGKVQVRNAFVRIARFFKHGLRVKQAGMEILETGDTALVLARTLVEAPEHPRDEREAVYVFRKLDGQWLCAIDNSYGHRILGKGEG